MLKYFLGRTKSVLRNPRLTVAWLKFVPCLADIVVVFSLSWLQFSAGPEYRTGRREERGGTRWCNLSPDIHHCYSTKMLSIVCQILGLGHHYHWYHTPTYLYHPPPPPSPPPLFPLINQQSNLPKILHTRYPRTYLCKCKSRATF